MTDRSFPIPLAVPNSQRLRLAALAPLLALAACASPGPVGGPDIAAPKPQETQRHYKVGSPYRINGRTYTPKEDPKYNAVGIASWYGDAFHGKATANGEVFDKERLSAAHKTLPLPSLVEVENLETGRTAILRVNDRGPFVDDRVIDVSHAAARVLGFEGRGLAKVRVRYVGPADLFAEAPRPGQTKPIRVAVAEPAKQAAVPSTPAAAPPRADLADQPDPVGDLLAEALAATPDSEIWIVVGEFSDLNALEKARVALGAADGARVMSSGAAYELQIGPEIDVFAAEARLAALREAGYPDARLADDTL